MSQVCIMLLVMILMKVHAVFSGEMYIEYQDVAVSGFV